jgi:hypothetical protein
MATDSYEIQYGSDGTRSAGDAGFSSFRAADKAFVEMLTEHPEALTTLYEKRPGKTDLLLARLSTLTDHESYVCSRYRDLGGKA